MRIACTGDVSEATLAQIEAALKRHPDAVDLRFAHACLLEDLGRLTRARGAYKAVLARDPAHLGALTNLATLHYRAHQHAEARALYREAARRHPGEAVAMGNLSLIERVAPLP